MKRIAFCLGGETRTFNDISHKELNFLIEQLDENGFESDVYGNTWEHASIPDTSLVKNFKKLIIEDQISIDNWIMREFPVRVFSDRKYNRPFEDPEEMVRFYLDMSRDRYGQFVSGVQSLQMPDNSYDIIIRVRWDCKFNYKNVDHDISNIVYEFNKIVNINDDDNLPYCLATADSRLGGRGNSGIRRSPVLALGDMFIVFNNLGRTDFVSDGPYDLIDEVNSLVPKTHHTPFGHQQWSEALCLKHLHIETTLPNIFQTHRMEGDYRGPTPGYKHIRF